MFNKIRLRHFGGLNCVPFPIVYIEPFTLTTWEWECIWREGFQEAIYLKWPGQGGPWSHRAGSPYMKRTFRHTKRYQGWSSEKERPCDVQHNKKAAICEPTREDLAETKPADTGAWPSSFQNCEKTRFCCLSHSMEYFVTADLANKLLQPLCWQKYSWEKLKKIQGLPLGKSILLRCKFSYK